MRDKVTADADIWGGDVMWGCNAWVICGDRFAWVTMTGGDRVPAVHYSPLGLNKLVVVTLNTAITLLMLRNRLSGR